MKCDLCEKEAIVIDTITSVKGDGVETRCHDHLKMIDERI